MPMHFALGAHPKMTTTKTVLQSRKAKETLAKGLEKLYNIVHAGAALGRCVDGYGTCAGFQGQAHKSAAYFVSPIL